MQVSISTHLSATSGHTIDSHTHSLQPRHHLTPPEAQRPSVLQLEPQPVHQTHGALACGGDEAQGSIRRGRYVPLHLCAPWEWPNGQSREPPCKYHKNPVFQEAEHRLPGEVLRPGTVVNNFILSTWESEAGKSLWVSDQPVSYSEFQAS